VRVKLVNLLLLGGAFVIAGIASGTGISRYDGGDLSGLITFACLIVFATTAAYMWSVGTVKGQRLEWDRLVHMLGGESSLWSASVRGTSKGLPVFARMETASRNAEYLHPLSAQYSASKYFFTLTVTFPYTGRADWRIVFRPKQAGETHGEWRAICEDSRELELSLEAAGVTDFFADWDPYTVLRCEAETGELTLRYPAPYKFFCPTTQEVENEINLLRRAAAIWQHAIQPKVAA
jgi:hypothetical protein